MAVSIHHKLKRVEPKKGQVYIYSILRSIKRNHVSTTTQTTLLAIRKLVKGVVRVGPFFLHCGNLLDDFSGAANRNRVRRNVLRHDGSCADSAAPPDGDARQNDDLTANPTVILDFNGMSKLDKLDSGQRAGFVAGRVDVHVRAELDPVSNDDKTGIQDGETVARG